MLKKLFPLGAIGIAGLIVASSVAPPASAQQYRYYPPRKLGPHDPSYSGVPNVPDEQGCVKWCFRDTGPCDPPEFKRADGRCEFPF